MGQLIVFYKYIDIQYPEQIVKWQKNLATPLNLTGRVIIAHEGINATLAGEEQEIAAYIAAMNEHPLFGEIDYKITTGSAALFPRLYIVVRSEIVNLGVPLDQRERAYTGQHLSPQEVHELLTNKPDDLVILDTRNNFESAIGTFKDALIPDIYRFRELPAYLEQNLDQFKDKQVLMFCTAGVRCEPISAYLNQKQVAKKVYQIRGGIQRYIEAYPDGHFRGKNYVFDGRIAVRVNDDVLGKCLLCQTACDDYTNCLNASCNKHYLACPNCLTKFQNCCSEKCQHLVNSAQVAPRPPRPVLEPTLPSKS
ncbi:MAG TPA: rhodanese-related sulfurtransferase [Candidatus Babeliales bacterium]|nr:rhodanese-related sulfurtransferase [Candidatus Babeliales bacterium]